MADGFVEPVYINLNHFPVTVRTRSLGGGSLRMGYLDTIVGQTYARCVSKDGLSILTPELAEKFGVKKAFKPTKVNKTEQVEIKDLLDEQFEVPSVTDEDEVDFGDFGVDDWREYISETDEDSIAEFHTVATLKDIANKIGASISGNKMDIIGQLKDFVEI